MPPEISDRVKGGIPGTEGKGPMRTNSFQEVTPEGKVVWEWLAYEHLDPEIDILCPMCARDDWTHTNSCYVLPNGDVMTTFRHTDTIGIIDKKTGDIKWRWGPGEIAHPHNPTMLDNGNILVFDNGFHRKGLGQGFSQIVEINPNTGEIEWEYRDNPGYRFYSFSGSGCERLPNGNTLICDMHRGRIFEVTRDKEKVWEYISPFYFSTRSTEMTNRVVRAFRYAPGHPALKGRELNPDRLELTLRTKPRN